MESEINYPKNGNRPEHDGNLPECDGDLPESLGLDGGEILLAANNRPWRASYGVSPHMGRILQQRNDQIQDEVQNIRPQGQWQPNPDKLRNWTDPLDDPYTNRELQNLIRYGLPRVFRPQPQYYDWLRR